MAKRVIIYSTPACPYCIRLKQFLKEHDIVFENHDVSADPAKAQEMMRASGQMGVPVLDIEGEIIVGFEKEKIRSALGI